jgi:hypothetical protein
MLAESLKDSIDRLSLIKSIINQGLIKASTENLNKDIEKHFVLIVKIYGNYEANMCF